MSMKKGNYIIHFNRELGSGSFATVYKARHKQNGSTAAAKKIKYHGNGSINSEMRQMARD